MVSDQSEKDVAPFAAFHANWAKGYAPYARALKKLKLPRRYKARDPRNIRRQMAVIRALHELKIKLQPEKQGSKKP